MLIVCPNCATSYMVDDAKLGAAGRMVRCARCRNSWLATPPKAIGVGAFVDDVIAEAEAEAPREFGKRPVPPPAADDAPPPADDFGAPPDHNSHSDLPPPPPVARDIPAEPPELASPPLVPPPGEPSRFEAMAADDEQESGFAARRARMQQRRKTSRRSSRWTAILLVLFGFNVALIGARGEVVRYFPQTASLFAAIGLPVNLRNLNFEGVKISKETADGVAVLVVEGRIVSLSKNPVEVPRLRFAVRNAAGQEIYNWTALPSRSILPPGETLPFRSQLAAPPADANDVLVRFFNAQDAAPGAK